MQEIICVLDRSGSMQTVKTDAVAGFNRFLSDQQKLGEANLTLVWFDDSFDVSYEGHLSEARQLNLWPNGGFTALTDAIGKTFSHVRERFNKEKPEKVILAILTDGQENASREFSKQHVADLIKEHQEKYNWTVIFLGADQDVWTVAQQYSIRKENAFEYCSADTLRGFGTLSSAVYNARVDVDTSTSNPTTELDNV
jgi:uncharacterized protein YegL